MEFSTEKVLKNRFSKKFRGIFRGKSLSAEKNVRKIGPSDWAKVRPFSAFFSENIAQMLNTLDIFCQNSQIGQKILFSKAPFWAIFGQIGRFFTTSLVTLTASQDLFIDSEL
jgi:hypothetical protein